MKLFSFLRKSKNTKDIDWSEYNLGRFYKAQEYKWGGYEDAIREIHEGQKKKHWIWYIFPQINGLGHSDYSEYYGIGSLDEARAYLKNPILGVRLREASKALLAVRGKTAVEILGEIDAMKVRSCMTLFDIISSHDVFDEVLKKYYQGKRCELTTERFGIPQTDRSMNIMKNVKMLGALAGDIIGSVYEFRNTKSMDFELFCSASTFTDDSVMTLAVARWLMEDERHTPEHLIRCMQELGHLYPDAGYGGSFAFWLASDEPKPYDSWGNGAGMRVSPVGLYAKTIDEALALAAITASVSHNHSEGIKGAQAIAASVFLCKEGKSKAEIKKYVERMFGYDLNRKVEDIREWYEFDVSCQGSVPEAIIAFLEGNSFEEVIRLAVSLGGDSDTIACMAGAIAACCYEIPESIAQKCNDILTDDLREIKDNFIALVEQRESFRRRIKSWIGY